ncbi:LysR family transcriptional regulator, glycine cleavage system transcriptional activator [Bosea sp. 62]|uniref:transcriptional regulator GcvA n=1 Tax=unclassified Bosea (in: a-proteobacteria) TaxID=2653178 RepID=UPI0012522AFD|nr:MULTISPECIES: transcriptional regulator GcvA [unclassified Bosea (in: a-proteobacteria)]CAD5246472.1 LysR family transcriptional regulator, glycine cleavage system transcriptional activator [Bosea sp. 46]CAD5248384.1 LysR family transcriptional regulator, glycine cleavage system transcriptional activator [Bosea sp. 21B]CAD5267629.1 LysR family transcriptional regulator, glycine cleavage system transcriptional activator [Bosea sp. 7B]VVT45482.1 LysR family transcriptional regulator, glycine c
MRSSLVLPPLHALRAFEAVGRLLSFRRAGEELLITQSAVSHHVRTLEEALGTMLFERRGRSIALTTAGARYLDCISQAFAMVADGTREVRSHATRQLLTVSLLPSFAANWLVSRLDDFRTAYPQIDLVLDPTLNQANLAAGEADVAIRYGVGEWPGLRCELLATERLMPVMSPELAVRQPLARTDDILAHTLLTSHRPTEWEAWSRYAAVDLASGRRLQLTDYNIVLQAALNGQGVAMGRSLLVADYLRRGALVAPLPGFATATGLGYWAVLPGSGAGKPAATMFVNWLRREIAEAGSAGRQSLPPK